jgi:hypothetical protein
MKTSLFCILIVLGATSLPASTCVSAQTTVAPSSYSSGPVTEYQKALPDSRDVLRFRRGERYNSPDAVTPEIGEDSQAMSISIRFGDTGTDPSPFGTSDTVVVGSVDSGQAFLSNDKQVIYSEFVVSIQEVIKAPHTPYIAPDQKIDIERRGGVIRLPSGKLITRGSAEQSMPTVGRRYLLFLKYSADTNDYLIETGYELFQGHAYSLDDADQNERSWTPVRRPLHQKSDDEGKFLEEMRARSSQKDGAH